MYDTFAGVSIKCKVGLRPEVVLQAQKNSLFDASSLKHGHFAIFDMLSSLYFWHLFSIATVFYD